MYRLSGKNKAGERITLDEIPDDFAEQHDAAYCGQYWPNHTDFELTKIEEVDNAGQIQIQGLG